MSTFSVELSKVAPKLSANLKVNRKKQAVNNLVAILFDTIRMNEWEYVEPDTARTHNGVGAMGGFKFESTKKLSIWVTPELVEVRKGIRKFPIGNGKDAATLFNNLKHVKAVIAKAQAEHVAGESSVNAILSEALDDITSGDDAVTADDLTEDIHISAPAFVDPIEVTSESEEVAGALENQMERQDDPLTRTKEALDAPETELGAALFGSDDPDDDTFKDVLSDPRLVTAKIASAKRTIHRVENEIADEDEDTEVRYNLTRNAPAGATDSLEAEWKHPRLGYVDRIPALKSLQGRVLGIVDAVFADKTQREAVKTLINKEFRREIGKTQVGSDEN